MLETIVAALFFFGPAGMANLIPVPASKVPILKDLDYPIDFHKTWRGKRIFGDHKTIRGFVVGFLGALLILSLERSWYESSEWIRNEIAFADYSSINLFFWAFVFTLGVLGGDAIKSFFKRQRDRRPGSTWFPFDQLDYVAGGLLMSLFLVRLDLADYLVIAIIFFLLHPITTMIGYLLRLKDSPI